MPLIVTGMHNVSQFTNTALNLASECDQCPRCEFLFWQLGSAHQPKWTRCFNDCMWQQWEEAILVMHLWRPTLVFTHLLTPTHNFVRQKFCCVINAFLNSTPILFLAHCQSAHNHFVWLLHLNLSLFAAETFGNPIAGCFLSMCSNTISIC